MSLEADIRHRMGGFVLEARFAVPEGGVTALFGPSGAGKTSIVHVLAGLLRPRQGRVVIGGQTMLDTQAGIFVPPERRRLGLVFQEARLFPHMRVEDNLLFGWRRAPKPAGTDEIGRIIALLDLERLLTRSPRGLSGGEKARVALGRALLASPRALLLDEPLANLDAGRRAEILPWLERLRDNFHLPMIYVSHAVEEVARLADRVVMLKDGKVTAQGPAAELLTALGPEAGAGLGAVIEAVAGQCRDGLTEFHFDGGCFFAAVAMTQGQRLKLRIAAEDILIAREAPRGISANNVLAATIDEISVKEPHADIGLKVGTARLTARITAASCRRLDLAPRMEVFAIVKSVAVCRSYPG